MEGHNLIEYPTYKLSTTPEGIVDSLLDHFNSRNIETMLGFYEDDAVIISSNGEPRRGKKEIARELQQSFGFSLPIKITGRKIYSTDNLASLVLEWKIVGTGNNGEKVDITGTSSDYAKKGSDGYWRCWFGNPFGVQVSSLF
ncbi:MULTISPECIES: YybH family protein [Sphingobacterium]|uniref:YybH family protein n=1 Tax=Sphingobacterium TaxID=28453 RepID=UPI00257C9E45|nr:MULTISPECIES: DUF4440 domain-containing protein [Sphingobacterium]